MQSSNENTKKTVRFTTDEVTPPETNEAEKATIGVDETTTETQETVVNEVREENTWIFQIKTLSLKIM